MRLIDADELKKALVDFMNAFIDSDGDMMYSDHLLIDADYIALCDYIDKQPTVQSKKGKWIEYEQEFMLEEPFKTVQKTVRECSVCTAKIAGMVGIMNYCPNCGADMRGEKDG